MPLYLFCYDSQGLISGSAELREQAALGLGELIEVTSEEALKEFVIPITGYALCESQFLCYATSSATNQRAVFLTLLWY